MKGQVLIILSVLLILFLFLVRNLALRNFFEEKEIEELEFINLKEEMFISANYYPENLEDFLKFARNSFSSRGKSFSCMLVSIYYPKIEENKVLDLNVSFLNLLGHKIRNLSITFSFDNSSKIFYSVEDWEIVKTSFSFNISSNENYTITISFENYEEEIVIPFEIGKSKLLEFVDFSLKNNFQMGDKLKAVLEF